jgi:hypothetical protein
MAEEKQEFKLLKTIPNNGIVYNNDGTQYGNQQCLLISIAHYLSILEGHEYYYKDINYIVSDIRKKYVEIDKFKINKNFLWNRYEPYNTDKHLIIILDILNNLHLNILFYINTILINIRGKNIYYYNNKNINEYTSAEPFYPVKIFYNGKINKDNVPIDSVGHFELIIDEEDEKKYKNANIEPKFFIPKKYIYDNISKRDILVDASECLVYINNLRNNKQKNLIYFENNNNLLDTTINSLIDRFYEINIPIYSKELQCHTLLQVRNDYNKLFNKPLEGGYYYKYKKYRNKYYQLLKLQNQKLLI